MSLKYLGVPNTENMSFALYEGKVSQATQEKMHELMHCHNIVTGCLQELNRTVPIGTLSLKIDDLFTKCLKKTCEGSSGFTFICNIHKLDVSLITGIAQGMKISEQELYQRYSALKTELNARYIFKWSSAYDQSIQLVYNKYYRLFGFVSPYSFLANKDQERMLLRHCQQKCDAMENMPDHFQLTYTLGFHGANMKDILQNGTHLTFSMSDWQNMFFTFGKCSALDIFLGNHDRIMNFQECRLNPYWNLGNIMCDYRDRQLFFIDNGIPDKILPKTIRLPEKTQSHKSVGFGDEMIAEGSDSEAMAVDEGEGCSGKNDLLSQQEGLVITEAMHAFCSLCFEEYSFKFDSFSQNLVKLFFKNIVLPQDYHEGLFEEMCLAWRKGCLEMLSSLKSTSLQIWLQILDIEIEKGSVLSCFLSKMIKKNQKIVSQFQP